MNVEQSPITISQSETSKLEDIAKSIRYSTIKMVHDAKSCHLGSSLSCIDILVALYFCVMNVFPAQPNHPDRDRFIMSKGHAMSGLLVTLAKRGYFPEDELRNYLGNGTYFTAHVNYNVPGIEVSTGSLGHGLPIGLGMALAAKMDSKPYKTYVLLSDGECDEGSNWEAALAAHHFQMGNVIAIVDYNKIQSFGRVSEIMELEPFAEKWKAFGWNVHEVNGHSIQQLTETLSSIPQNLQKPTVVIAHTVKGKGGFQENTIGSHYWTPTDEELEKAKRDLL